MMNNFKETVQFWFWLLLTVGCLIYAVGDVIITGFPYAGWGWCSTAFVACVAVYALTD